MLIRAIYDVKGIDMGTGLVRYKAEVDFDGRELTKYYLDQQDLEAILKVRKGSGWVRELFDVCVCVKEEGNGLYFDVLLLLCCIVVDVLFLSLLLISLSPSPSLPPLLPFLSYTFPFF